MENNKNEIDLFELLLKIYLYIKQYWYIIAGAIVFAILITFVKFKSAESYTSSMIISVKPESDYMYAMTFREFNKRFEKNPAEIVCGIIDQFNEMINNENYELLAQKLNISVDNAKSLKSINTEYNFEEETSMSNIIKIIVNASKVNVYNKLGKKITFALNNNAFVKKKNTEDSLMLLKIIKETENKINDLNNFSKKEFAKDIVIFNYHSIFAESVMLNSLKEKLSNELRNLKQAKLVEDFYIPKYKTSSFIKPLIINIIFFIIIALIIIFFIVFNQKAKEYQNKINKQ